MASAILCGLAAVVNAQPVLELTEVATGFSNPVDIVSDGGDRLFIVEQAGRIKIMDLEGNVHPTPFMDISNRVNDSQSEQGLLGLAFPPDFATSQVFYVNYTGGIGSGRTYISRFAVDAMDPDKGDPDTESIVLEFDQPLWNHNGGDLNFGPEGYLYIATGDGGGAGDLSNNAQNRSNLLGKILRIDVDTTDGYRLPEDNPFFGMAGLSQEIWSYGLRNPWRFSFDRETGDMWIGDVGQNAREEINFEPAGEIEGGINYGWRCYEGLQPFNNAGCNNEYVFPIYQYAHNNSGGFSVTGGFRYRGAALPHITGDYIFCDYVTGNFWITYAGDATGEWETVSQSNLKPFISTFGEGPDGEIYAAQHSSGTIYKLIASCPDIAFSVTITLDGDTLRADLETGQFQWTLNGNPINGANGSTYAPVEDGDYAVEVIINDMGCVYETISNTVTFSTPVSTVFDETHRLNVYPNPVQDILRVDLGILREHQIRSWQLTNIQGSQFLVRSYFEEGALMIDAKHLDRGYYYLELQTDDGVITGRFMVR
jgi:glucose/arabinose dehydrogenase